MLNNSKFRHRQSVHLRLNSHNRLHPGWYLCAAVIDVQLGSLRLTRFIQAATCHQIDQTISSSFYFKGVPRFDSQSLTAYSTQSESFCFSIVVTPSCLFARLARYCLWCKILWQLEHKSIHLSNSLNTLSFLSINISDGVYSFSDGSRWWKSKAAIVSFVATKPHSEQHPPL